ncbi:hypothetical protein SAMN05428957_11144 [Oryzisolibacter propanilivorax]|uniref:Uncharacterized protein n=1 Tax=Oryzisolibacter propanilivorax TaxID=1527607 RepID=A0A1G9V553_9BURK|nr:hypothetical protein [Oryzisolibacter propanilivorax]SDM67331.1 hypothetical protein SAMN05428957_11144 [Oryzisolibacter propanilivorax]
MWLDTALHQAAGLHSFTPERQLRLLPVVSQSNAAGSTELEMLWQLCSSLQRLSYAVVVLDGTALEDERTPGLAQLLGGLDWPGSTGAADGASLAVVPAARGLAQLARHTGPVALTRLAGLFRSYAVAVLYAPVERLSCLVQASAGVPLVMTGPAAQGLVGAYRQLKHLALHAGPPACVVASVRPPGARMPPAQTAEALATLQHSAQAQLGLRVHTTAVDAARAQDIQRLALQLLENACTMQADIPCTAAGAFAAPPLEPRH